MKYYRLLENVQLNNKWTLGDLRIDNPWKFANTEAWDVPNDIPIQEVLHEGIIQDVSLNASTTIIANDLFAELFNNEEIQKIPVRFDKIQTETPYYILVVKQSLDCIDEKNSDFDRWDINNPIRPDKAGRYKGFYKMKVRADLQSPLKIFRVQDYSIAILVNEEIKSSIERLGLTGIRLKEV